MEAVSYIGHLCVELESYKNSGESFNEIPFDGVLSKLSTLAADAFGLEEKIPSTVHELNELLRSNAIPYRIDYASDRGFFVEKITYTLTDGNVKKIAQSNLQNMLDSWNKEPAIYQYGIEKFAHEFTVMYDIAYEQFILHTSTRDYDIEDINLLLYHRRIGYQVKKTGNDIWGVIKVNW